MVNVVNSSVQNCPFSLVILCSQRIGIGYVTLLLIYLQFQASKHKLERLDGKIKDTAGL
jgi:hypothetical protein